MMGRYHLAAEEDDQAALAAVTRYFAEHPELNPDRVSVSLVPDDDAGYRAVGHEVIGALPSSPVPAVPDISLDTLGEAAFCAYAMLQGHNNHTMDVAEPWSNQGPDIRAGFRAAADAVQMLLGLPSASETPAAPAAG